jgi:hypothetical protein
MAFSTIEELFKVIKVWFEEDIPEKRLNLDSEGRKWYIDVLSDITSLKSADLRKATQREDLNKEYITRYKVDTPAERKGISALKLEISQLYSFNKVLVLRHRTRVQYYKDDLSQKGARNMYTLWQSFAPFKRFKDFLNS